MNRKPFANWAERPVIRTVHNNISVWGKQLEHFITRILQSHHNKVKKESSRYMWNACEICNNFWRTWKKWEPLRRLAAILGWSIWPLNLAVLLSSICTLIQCPSREKNAFQGARQAHYKIYMKGRNTLKPMISISEELILLMISM